MKPRGIVLALALCLAGLLLTVPLQAQPAGQRYEYVSLWKVKLGKGGEFVEMMKKVSQPAAEHLLAEGVVLAWGIDEAFVHTPGGDSHVVWWQAANQGAIQRVMEEVGAEFVKFSPEESQKFVATLESHHDLVLRHIIATVKPSTGARPFHWVAAVKVQPGKGEEYDQLWRKYNQPAYEKALAEGHLLGYSLHVEEVHTEDPNYRYLWFAFPDLPSREKAQALVRAARQALPETERRSIELQFQAVTEPTAHRDLLFRAIIYVAK